MMSRGFTDATLSADDLYCNDMKGAGQTMRAVLHGEKPAPRGLRWDKKSGGNQWGTYHAFENERIAARLAEKERVADLRRTDRDPCRRCGARGDANCGHRAW